MIKYDRFWETLKKRHISQYSLYTYYGVNRKLLDKFRKNENVEIYTLDRICTILDCNIEDIVEQMSQPSQILQRNKGVSHTQQNIFLYVCYIFALL